MITATLKPRNMERNLKWVPGLGAVLLTLLSHMISALEVPLDRKYHPQQYHFNHACYLEFPFCKVRKCLIFSNTCNQLRFLHSFHLLHTNTSSIKCLYFAQTCCLFLANKTNGFPQCSVTAVRLVVVDKKLKYWKDVSWPKHCYDS